MDKGNLFYHYYDILFSTKDYAGEINAVLALCRACGLERPARILDVGCGTANHALTLADRGMDVTAFDTDPLMAALAKEKVKASGHAHIRCTEGPPSALGAKFDLVIALFHVVTYIREEKELDEFLAGVRSCLGQGGLFIFDFWNGTGVKKSPPGEKITEAVDGRDRVICHLTSQCEFKRDLVTLDYHIRLVDEKGRETAAEHYPLEQKLWTIDQIYKSLRKAKLEVIRMCWPYDPAVEARKDDWKVMLVCRGVS